MSSICSAFLSCYGLRADIDSLTKNRNHGNIQTAKIGIEQSSQGQNVVRLKVSQDVNSANGQLQHVQNFRQNFSDDYLQRIEEVNINARKSYATRTIDLISFIDKIRALLSGILLKKNVEKRHNPVIEFLNRVYTPLLDHVMLAIGGHAVNQVCKGERKLTSACVMNNLL